MRGLGFDGTNTMSGHRSGVQIRLRLHAPSSIYVHCRCHKLQLAVLNAASEHTVVKRVLGTLLTIWKAFHFSPKKAEKLAEIQAELQAPEIKMQKPSDTRWLARERAVSVVRRILPALVSTFEEIYAETGDAESHGIATLLLKYKTVACIYMLSDVLHIVAKLQGSLQAKDIDLASVPSMVASTTKRLLELKEDVTSSTWFKEHSLVFTDDAQLGEKHIVVLEEEKSEFLHKVYRPYLQSVIDHINVRMESTELISAMSVFDPRHLPGQKKNYQRGDEGISQPDIEAKETESEWKLFRRLIFLQYKGRSLQFVLSRLLGNGEIYAAFPNLAKIAAILEVLPVTTATVERSFSNMKLIKTRLRSRMSEETLDYCMRICIEGSDHLSDENLEAVLEHYKGMKIRKINL
ncbi:Zinc finger protein [Oopsacas minuta]|uniref:Zinc finger protein n=1 Tax=Oopsacas minuta TaxID=111878 RepID=A0AAV7JM97_9METZ|nr:Zinc finger protein [Oopsacas minuta]